MISGRTFKNEKFIYVVNQSGVLGGRIESCMRLDIKTKKWEGPRYAQDGLAIKSKEQCERIWK